MGRLSRFVIVGIVLVLSGAVLTILVGPQQTSEFVRGLADTARPAAGQTDAPSVETPGLGEYVDLLADLAANPPAWLAVVVIVGMTFGGAALLAFLAREKPKATVVEPPHIGTWRQREELASRPAVTVAALPRTVPPSDVASPPVRRPVVPAPPPPRVTPSSHPRALPTPQPPPVGAEFPAAARPQTLPRGRGAARAVRNAGAAVARVLKQWARVAVALVGAAIRLAGRALGAARPALPAAGRMLGAAGRACRAALERTVRALARVDAAAIRAAQRGVSAAALTASGAMRAASRRVTGGVRARTAARGRRGRGRYGQGGVSAWGSMASGATRAAGRWVAQGVRVRTVALSRRRGESRQSADPAEPPSDWMEVARRVHAEVGGDLPTVLRVAEGIRMRHRQFARQVRTARRPARHAARALGVLPPGVIAVSAAADPGYLERLAANAVTLHVAGAALLAVAGWWWLKRLAQPPFSLRPAVRAAHERARVLTWRLGAVLERAALYAAAGLAVDAALMHATRADSDAPGQGIVRLLSSAHAGELSVRERETSLGRCALVLVRWLEDGAAASDALALSAACVRHEYEWAALPGGLGLPVGLALPLLVAVLPAAVLFARV